MCTKTSDGQHRITTDEALRYIVRVSGHASMSREAGIGLTSKMFTVAGAVSGLRKPRAPTSHLF